MTADYRAIAPPYILLGSARCQLQVVGAGETFRSIAGRPYVPFSRAYVESRTRMLGGPYPPPLILDVIRTCCFTGMCPDSAWPSSQHSPGEDPSQAANDAAGYKLVMTPPMGVGMASAHLAQGHPLLVSGFIYTGWPTASEVTPGFDMFRVPTDPGSNTGIPHLWEVLGENSYGWIVRDPRTPIFVNLPKTYPAGTWWAVTDCIETAPPADPGNPDVAALIVEMDSLAITLEA